MKFKTLFMPFVLGLSAMSSHGTPSLPPVGDENGNPASSITPIQEGTKAMEVAELANRIWRVEVLKGSKAIYKIVELDSELSSDFTSTIVVLAAEQEIGGAAGFESAFQIGPNLLHRLESAKIVRGKLELKGTVNLTDPAARRIVLEYNSSSKELKVVK